jgi:hypothetical protein
MDVTIYACSRLKVDRCLTVPWNQRSPERHQNAGLCLGNRLRDIANLVAEDGVALK